jgi:hypothetical protein
VKSPARILWLALAILGFALGLRLAGINKSVWIDEVGSYALANSDDFLTSARGDIHPPLYYALLRGAMAVTHSVPLLRLISVTCGLLTIAVFLRLPSRFGALVAAALLACSPEMIANSQELRQYALLNLGLAIALLATLRLIDEPDAKAARGWLLLGSIVATSTHLLAIFFVSALGAALLFFQQRRTWRERLAAAALLLPSLGLALAFRFWFLSHATEITTNWWTGAFSPAAAANAFGTASGWEDLAWLAGALGRHSVAGQIFFELIFASAISLVGWAAWSHRERRSMVALFIAITYWVAIAAYSWLSVNVAIARVILPGMLPLFASIGLGLASRPPSRLQRGATIALIALALLMTVPWSSRFAWKPREDLRGFAGALRETYRPGDVLIFLRGTLALQVYWPECETETQAIKLELREPADLSIRKIDEQISAHGAGAAIIVVYRGDEYFKRRQEIWRELEAHLRRIGRDETSIWDQDFYHIVRFAPPLH